MERQSLLALSEYVPGAQVLVGGKIVESKAILNIGLRQTGMKRWGLIIGHFAALTIRSTWLPPSKTHAKNVRSWPRVRSRR